MAIENTSRRPLIAHVAGAFAEGPDGYVEGMEAAGTGQLLASELLPVDMHPEDPAEWTALGFAFGDTADGDPLFRRATLPEGWTRQATDDPRGSYLVDSRGIHRVTIFYKAAFYDRAASMSLVNVGRYAAEQAIYGDGEPTAPWDALDAAERAGVVAEAERYRARAAEHPQIYGERLPRAEALLAQAPGAEPAP